MKIIQRITKKINFKILSEDIKIFKRFGIIELLSFTLLFISSYLLNKNLPKAELGNYSYYSNLMLLFYPLFCLNISDSYNRFLNLKNIDKYSLIKLVKQVSVWATIIMFIITFFFFSSFKIATLSFAILFFERINYFKAKTLTKQYSVLKILNSSFILIGVIYVIFNNELNYLNVILIYGLSYLSISILGFLTENNDNSHSLSNKKSISLYQILKYTIPVVGTSMVIWVLNFSDQYFIKLFFTDSDLGEYSIGYRAINIIRLVTGFFLVYWPIMYFRSFEEKKFSNVFKVRFFFLAIIFMITIGSVLFSDLVYIIIGANDYLGSIFYFKILIISELFRVIASIFMTYRSFQLKTYYNLYIISVVSFINVLLNYLFIEDYGVVFAAYSTLVSTFIYLIFSIIFSLIPEYRFYKSEKFNIQSS